MERAWRWIKAIALFIGLGCAAAWAIARFRLRRVEGAGNRVQGHIDELGRGIGEVSDHLSEALGDNRELSGKIESAAGELRNDIDQAEKHAGELKGTHQRTATALERLEAANRKFAGLINETDQKK